MIPDKKEIETILNNAEQILINQPHLVEMSFKDIINVLSDTEQMIRDRWGVVALLVINSIKKWDLPNIVKQLSSVECSVLTCEYVGYLLQNKYGVDMEALLIEADRQDKFDCIAAYVSPNLQLLPKINEQYISKLLQTLEKHSNSKSYNSIVYNYAKGIEICHAFHTVANTLDDINSKAEYDLMNYLGSTWYRNNVAEANQEMKKLLEYPSDWSKKVAIDFIGFSLEYDKTAFEELFPQIENLLLQCDDLWLYIISVFVKYVLLFSKDSDTNCFYAQALTHLRKLPHDSQKAKCCFLRAIQWEEELPNDIQEIFQSIILNPFETNQCPLDMLDFILYKQAKHGGFEAVIKCMLDIFRINKYHHRRTEFFEGLSSATGELSKCSEKVTIAALKYMLANDIDQMFFGLGWLMRSGNLQKLLQDTEKGIVHFTSAQLIRIMKTVLYFSVDGSKICNVAFQLLALLSESTDNYIAFCMEELYENYPNTMFDVSKNYITSTVESQTQLAELVSNAHEKTRCEYEVISEINDLCPSWEHHYIYRKAIQKQNKQISQNATKQSFFESFFQHQTLKYGARSAHVVQGSKGERCYHSSPYQHFIHKMELPASYVDDPIGFEVKKTDFLSEVLGSAHDN